MHQIVSEERRLLDRTLSRLNRQRREHQIDVNAIAREMESLRDQMRDADHDERPSMLMQYERLGHVLSQAGRSVHEGGIDPARPYFAHMRLHDDDGPERDIFLGNATRLDNGLRIVDWRDAPVSRIFYRYAEGDDYDEDLGERQISGELLARRVLSIEGGELRRVQSPQGIFLKDGDDWKTRDLAAPSLAGSDGRSWVLRTTQDQQEGSATLGSGEAYRIDKHLPEISALIDPAQWEIISKTDAELVVIRGVAGSGKTTVALHRLAYLNFQDGNRFRPNRMMVIVWGNALRRFIAKVLPQLGVHGTPVHTFAWWAAALRQRLFPMLPEEVSHDTPAVVARLKAHPGMLKVLESRVKRNKGPKTIGQVIQDWMVVLTDGPRLRRALNRHAPGAFSKGDIEAVLRWTTHQVDGIIEVLSPEDSDLDPEERDAYVAQRFMDAEDDALLLRLYQLRVGPLPHHKKGRNRPLRYQHLVIDEVQDFSPLEVRVLMDCVGETKSMTLAGDTQQHVLQEAGFTDWEAFFGHLGVQGAGVNTLQVAYRSTRPIVEFSRHVLGRLAEDEHVQVVRDGLPVEILPFGSHGECLGFLGDALRHLNQREPNASVALLARSAEGADLYFEVLKDADLARLDRVREQDFSFAPGVEITDVAQAKGLEFDYVVLLDVSADTWPDTDAARRLLHVGATRAMHQLWVMTVGTPSPILDTEEG